MELEFLGTGTSQGVPVIGCDCDVCRSDDKRDKRLRSSVILRSGAQTILVDGGPDMRQQLLRAGVKRLDAVLLTHEHADHIMGLDDLRSFNFRQGGEMPIYADERTQNALRRVYAYAFAEDKYPGIPRFELRTIDPAGFLVGDQQVCPIQVMHYQLPVWGFRMGDITYITDAKTIRSDEKRKIKGSKVLVLNALHKEPHLSHFTLEEALALIDELQPDRAFLTHIGHLMGKHQDVSVELPEGVCIAYDGLMVRTS